MNHQIALELALAYAPHIEKIIDVICFWITLELTKRYSNKTFK